jgi:hypothetical protein
MINHDEATGRTDLKTEEEKSDQRFIANKNSPLNPYVIDFFLPIDLPSVEFEGRVD